MIVTQSQTNFICPITQVLLTLCFIEAKSSHLLSDFISCLELMREERKVTRVEEQTWERVCRPCWDLRGYSCPTGQVPLRPLVSLNFLLWPSAVRVT